MEEMIAFPCTIMRGGTSKAVFFLEKDVPSEVDARRRFISAVFGSPDIRQIDGLGGADPLTSKCAIVGPAKYRGADVNYSFYQVGINSTVVEPALCGNISSAVGAFALYKGLVRSTDPITVVKAFNTFLNRIIIIELETCEGLPVVEGAFKIDGVPGTGSKVILDLKNAAGGATGSLLPTGHVRDSVNIEGIGKIELSIVDFASPCVFVRASDIGLHGTELPSQVDSDKDLLNKLETIRGTGAEIAGLIKDRANSREESSGNPILYIVSPPTDYKTFTGKTVSAKDINLTARAMFMQIMHKTFPGAGAFCTGVAARIEGTIVYDVIGKREFNRSGIIIGHPGGVMEVETEVEKTGDQFVIKKALLARTARKIMDGQVYIRKSLL